MLQINSHLICCTCICILSVPWLGEDVYISLYGAGEELSVQLRPDLVPLQKTYISLSTVHTVSFTNRYDIPLKFFWTIWPSLQEEALHMLRYVYTKLIVDGLECNACMHAMTENCFCSCLLFTRDGLVLSQRDEAERDQLLLQCESDPTAIHELPQVSKALQRHRSQCLQDSGITFSHSCITVEPAVGLITTSRVEYLSLNCCWNLLVMFWGIGWSLHGIQIAKISTQLYL